MRPQRCLGTSTCRLPLQLLCDPLLPCSPPPPSYLLPGLALLLGSCAQFLPQGMQPPLQLRIGRILGGLAHSQQTLTEHLGGWGGWGGGVAGGGAKMQVPLMGGRGSGSSLCRRYPEEYKEYKERIVLCATSPPPIPPHTSASRCNSRCPARALSRARRASSASSIATRMRP